MSSKFRSSDRDLERTIPTWRSESPVRSREARREWELLRARGGLPHRLLIDATYTLGSSRRSGIERVVHNLVDHGLALADGSQVTAATLMSMHGQFYEMGDQQQARLDRILTTQSDIIGSLPKLYQRCVSSLINFAGSPKLKNWLLPEPGHMGQCSSCRIAIGIDLQCAASASKPRPWCRAKGTCWCCPMPIGLAKKFGPP